MQSLRRIKSKNSLEARTLKNKYHFFWWNVWPVTGEVDSLVDELIDLLSLSPERDRPTQRIHIHRHAAILLLLQFGLQPAQSNAKINF